MNEEWMIDVAGVSAGGWQAETEELVMRAELIVAGQRILDMITRRDVEKIPLDASALRNLERILARAKEKRTLFLASGDPLYNGIGGTLRRYLPEERLRIHPNPTAFQELFAKLVVPWENAFVQCAWEKNSAVAENPPLKAGRDLLRCGTFRKSACR